MSHALVLCWGYVGGQADRWGDKWVLEARCRSWYTGLWVEESEDRQGPMKKEQGFVRGTKGRKVFRQWEQYCSSRTWQNWRAKIVWGGWNTEIKLGSVREQGLTHT